MRWLMLFGLWFILGGSAEEHQPVVNQVANTRFPPTFEDNAFSYGFALFSLTTISAVAVAILCGFAFEARNQCRTSEKIHNWISQPAFPVRSTVSIYRFQIISLLMMAVLGTLPDVLVLMAWGEASDKLMWVLFQIDRFGDGLAGIPFLCFAFSYLLSGNAVAHTLALDAKDVPMRPRWVQIKDEVKIVALAFVIAAGVTLYKATA